MNKSIYSVNEFLEFHCEQCAGIFKSVIRLSRLLSVNDAIVKQKLLISVNADGKYNILNVNIM